MLSDNYEEFTETQIKILESYVTNTSGHIFALRNLPEVIKGALFSRYSRSNLGLRELLLKEFVSNEEEAAFAAIAGKIDDHTTALQQAALKKAQNFYDRILDGYGDDSIGELGGAHLALENVSMLAAKVIEDSRIGGSPLEKSTRYIYFDQKVKGEYLFYREPVLMTSAYRDLYINTCNMLFETYSKLIPPLTSLLEDKTPKDPTQSKVAYGAALRSKVLDCLRGILPAGTLTNMGVYGNGRFFESVLHKLHCHPLVELQEIGRRSCDELTKVIPSFVRRAQPTHHTHQNFANFYEAMRTEISRVTEQQSWFSEKGADPGVRLLEYDPASVIKVAATLLFANSNKGLGELMEFCRRLPNEEISRILDSASNARESRRNKSPRALESALFTFEIISDFGVYRDLHRHRMLTQERQLLSCDYGFYVPPEIAGTNLEAAYNAALLQAAEVYNTIGKELREEAQYVVPMAYNVRWYFTINLRALQWLCELRSQPAGHMSYRYVAQAMAQQVSRVFPEFERFFKFVDFEGYELGRLGQEQRRVDKQLKN